MDERKCHGPCAGGKCPVPQACEYEDNSVDFAGNAFVAIVCVAVSLFMASVIVKFL